MNKATNTVNLARLKNLVDLQIEYDFEIDSVGQECPVSWLVLELKAAKEPFKLRSVAIRVATVNDAPFILFAATSQPSWEELDAVLADRALFPNLENLKMIMDFRSWAASVASFMNWGTQGKRSFKLQGLSDQARAQLGMVELVLNLFKKLRARDIGEVEWR